MIWRRGLREASLGHKESILKARASTTDPRVRAKYDWLAAYHDDAMRRFWPKPAAAEVLIGKGQ